jgi:tetratricopeptide (TPR) repeat protein
VKAALAKGDVESALPVISRILSLDPENKEAREFLKQVDRKLLVSTNYVAGVEAYGREDYAGAVEFLGMVFEVDPKYRDVAFLYKDAQSHLQPLQGMPKELTELYAKGVDLYMAGQYAKAVEVWEKVLAQNPKNFLVQRNLEEARAKMREGGASRSEGAKP